MKSLLKSIIQKSTAQRDDEDDEDERVPTSRTATKLLNYDLELLAKHAKHAKLQQVAIAIEGTETFDGDLLSELMEMLGFWLDRIPFILLLGVATSVNALQQRLSRAAVKCLDGQLFDVAEPQRQMEMALHGLVEGRPTMYPGPDLTNLILERQQDYIQSMDSFIHAARYAYMSHYYANALTLFLIPGLTFADVPQDHFEALRNVGSFRRHCDILLEEERTVRVRDLLNNNQVLLKEATARVSDVQQCIFKMMPALRVLHKTLCIINDASSTSSPSISRLYMIAIAGRLTTDSSLLRSTLLTIRKSPQKTILQLSALLEIADLPTLFSERFQEMHRNLIQLASSAAAHNEPLRSADDIQSSTLRTTVVAQKVELSKQKATLSKRDQAYTALVRRMSDTLEAYFNTALTDPKMLLFHELVIYDLRSPYRETFTPRPRHAIERALAAPHDYLDCECCAPDAKKGDGGTDATILSSSQPATAVLYQLYLESGSLINVYDLWQAFRAVMALPDERSDDLEGQTMALFQRGLAELRYLGLMKTTRKRADHVAKVAWRGL